MARLELRGVSKTYGKTVAVADINMVIEDNEFFCVFGPPSCGKTSVLRLLLGLVAPDDGEILIDDTVVTEKQPKDRNLAMVFQNLALFPHMTAGQNLAFPLAERKMDKAEIDRRVQAVAETLHIVPLLKKIPAHLSGGERQRVAIGRALVRDPAAFLMDEPIAALDARLREEMRVELKRLQREMNHTLIYVTHDQEEAMSVADRMAIFEDGRVRQTGTPDEIYNRPNSRYVAELIGSPPMNFVEGTLDRSRRLFEGSEFEFQIGVDAGEYSGGATLAVRPEDILIRRQAQEGAHIAAKIYEIEPLGAFTIVDVVIGEKLLKIQEAGMPQYELGEDVHLFLDPAKCHLFESGSGDLIRSAG
jgi:multiple sugar transport system ATP-binding protein